MKQAIKQEIKPKQKATKADPKQKPAKHDSKNKTKQEALQYKTKQTTVQRINHSIKWFFTEFFSKKTLAMLLVDFANAALLILIIYCLAMIMQSFIQSALSGARPELITSSAATMLYNKMVFAAVIAALLIIIITALLQSLGYAYFLGKLKKQERKQEIKQEKKQERKQVTKQEKKPAATGYFARFWQINLFCSAITIAVLVAVFYFFKQEPIITILFIPPLFHVCTTIHSNIDEQERFWQCISNGLKNSVMKSTWVMLVYLVLLLLYLGIITLLGITPSIPANDVLVWSVICVSILFVSIAKASNLLLTRTSENKSTNKK